MSTKQKHMERSHRSHRSYKPFASFAARASSVKAFKDNRRSLWDRFKALFKGHRTANK